MFNHSLRRREMREDLVTFLRQYYGTCRVLASIPGICQHQTQSKAWIRKCIGILQYDDWKHPYRQSVSLHECTHAFQRQRHVASSCTQGNRSAALVLPLLKTTFSCLVDTTSPRSVPIRESCSTGKEKFLFSSTLKEAVQSQGILVSGLTTPQLSFPFLLRAESLRLMGRYLFRIPHPSSRHSSTDLLCMEGRRSLCTLEMSRSLQGEA